MAASCFSVPTTTHSNINLNALPAVSSSFGSPSSRVSIISSISTSISISMPPSYSLQLSHVLSAIVPALNRRKVFRITAVAHEGSQVAEEVRQVPEDFSQAEPEDKVEQETKIQSAPKGAKLYVGNLPRSCDNAQLTQIFEEFGTVEAVEVICNKDTGISRGFAFVTMSTVKEANAAIEKLNGSDLGGRDIVVNVPARLLIKKREGEGATDETDKDTFVETPFKLYVGNLAWSVKPETLKELFSQHGNVLGARVLYDRKAGRSRVYGFVCFSSQSEVEAAIASLDEKEFHGRKLVVREAKAKSEDSGLLQSEGNISEELSTEIREGDGVIGETEENTFVGRPYEVYVGNLSWSVKPETLKELFSQHGNVLDTRVLYDRKSERSRAYGFVCFSSQSEVEAAIVSLDGKELHGRKLVVKEAKLKNEDLGGLDTEESFLEKLSTETKEGKGATTVKENASIDGACTVYVGNLSWTVKPDTLKELFNQHGNVLDARLLYDRKTGRSRVYGFVCFSSRSEVESAIASLHEKKFQGRKMVVREAKVKSEV